MSFLGFGTSSDDAQQDNSSFFSTGFVKDILGAVLTSGNDRAETKAAVNIENTKANSQAAAAAARAKYMTTASIAAGAGLLLLIIIKKSRG